MGDEEQEEEQEERREDEKFTPPVSLERLRVDLDDLKANLAERDRNSLSWDEVRHRVDQIVAQSDWKVRQQVEKAAEKTIDELGYLRPPEIHLAVTPQPNRLLKTLLKRMRIAMYGLSALGYFTLANAAATGGHSGRTLLIGLLASTVVGLTGLIVEFFEAQIP